MLTILFFEPTKESSHDFSELLSVAESVFNLKFTFDKTSVNYAHAIWKDDKSKASCIIDIGQIPLEEDSENPSNEYEGYKQLDFRIQIPIAGPHWYLIESLSIIEKFLEKFPNIKILETEDIGDMGDEENPPMPTDIIKLKILKSWEEQYVCQGYNYPIMDINKSIAIWRFKKETKSTIHILSKKDIAYSTIILSDDAPIIFPIELDYFTVISKEGKKLISVPKFLDKFTPKKLPNSNGYKIDYSEELQLFFENEKSLQLDNYKIVDDYEWTDIRTVDVN